MSTQLKRASAKLVAITSDDLLTVNRCLWGYVMDDKRLTHQRRLVYKTVGELLEAARGGQRPHDASRDHKGTK